MEAFTGSEPALVRLLGLGNELLADDAFGILVAREAQRRFPGKMEVVCSSASGFNLLDDVLGAARLLVVDTIITGRAKPGTVSILTAEQMRPAAGSPHSLGLFEVLAVGKRLGLPVPEKTIVIAVEASDSRTVGGPMHPDVQSAIPKVVELIGRILADGSSHPCGRKGS